MPESKFKIIRTRPVCKTEFRAKTLDSVYCSRICGCAAYRARKRSEIIEAKLRAISSGIPSTRQLLSVTEAVASYAVNRTTLYRQIRKGYISVLRFGKHKIRISQDVLDDKYPKRALALSNRYHTSKTYRLEPDDCYTIGEISENMDALS